MMTVVFRYAARSHAGLGRGRDLNEDSGYAGPRLLAVADGMGGHVAGEVASALTIAAIQPLDAPPTTQRPDPLGALAWAVKQANTRIAEWIRAYPAAQGMGTTLTALLMYGDRQLGLVHIGDCRAYLLRRGAMRRISRDHTLLQTLIDEGKLTREQAEVHPQRSMITRAMQGNDDEKARPDVYTEQVEVGDRILVCSDGLIDAPVPDHVIADTLDSHSNVDQAAAALVDLALRAGAPDNVTCVVADVVNSKGRRRSAPPTTPIAVGAVAAPNPAFGAPAPGHTPGAQGPAGPAHPAPQAPPPPQPQQPQQPHQQPQQPQQPYPAAPPPQHPHVQQGPQYPAQQTPPQTPPYGSMPNQQGGTGPQPGPAQPWTSQPGGPQPPPAAQQPPPGTPWTSGPQYGQQPGQQSGQQPGQEWPQPPAPHQQVEPWAAPSGPEITPEAPPDARHLNNGHAEAGQAPPSS